MQQESCPPSLPGVISACSEAHGRRLRATGSQASARGPQSHARGRSAASSPCCLTNKAGQPFQKLLRTGQPGCSLSLPPQSSCLSHGATSPVRVHLASRWSLDKLSLSLDLGLCSSTQLRRGPLSSDFRQGASVTVPGTPPAGRAGWGGGGAPGSASRDGAHPRIAEAPGY